MREQTQIVRNMQTMLIAKAWDSLEDYQQFLVDHLSPYEYSGVMDAFEQWVNEREASYRRRSID